MSFADGTEPAVLAGVMSEHLAKDGFFGEALLSRLADVRVMHDRGGPIELLTRVDRPLLAEDTSGRRHALRPGLMTADGRGPRRAIRATR